ncbi:hypothetical protein WMY93_019112 [Mugilogobius chulae]|uniref:Uncharacterized protein n=1 Tax=Mugilogobius chulae TaxID=88201 RepID=A0AAW0NHI2_9GOBI
MGGFDPFGADFTARPTAHQTVASAAVNLEPDPGPALDSGTGHSLLPDPGQSTVISVEDPAPPDAPVADSVAADVPVADAPVADAPVADAPVADAPVADAPVADGHVLADSPDTNGNGRLTVVSHSVTQRVPEVQTLGFPVSHDFNGNMDVVTSFPFELTASGLGLGPEATEQAQVLLHTESVGHVTHLVSTGVFSQTELVTAATETATDSGGAAVLIWRTQVYSLVQKPVQAQNRTTLRVLKVQKMWNWRIPADFHIKPKVHFLRFRFHCTSQSQSPLQPEIQKLEPNPHQLTNHRGPHCDCPIREPPTAS